MNSFSICISIILDYISFTFIGCVLLISSIVIFYSHSYIYDDIFKYRFLLLVFIFILSMILMIISPNMVRILLGWDGLGLVSYALVIYFQNYNSYNAGILTIITNRIGDVAILICIAWILNFGRWSYIYYMGVFSSYTYNIVIFAILAAFTKSAQIPFSSWLPAAIAAPTPVSALVHSSTLVTAGVYLMIRFSPFLYNFDCTFFAFISLMTILISGLGANFEFDLKKVIALSTLRQLGLIMGILFLGFPNLAFFHLLTHAFFKALLFLCAGLIIHVMNNSQDIRDIGYIIRILPYTSSCFIVSRFSLSGMPFLSGFYSRDLILEFFSIRTVNFGFYFIFMISVFFTISYRIRLIIYLIFVGSGNYVFQSYFEDIKIMFSMILLVFLSVFIGVILIWVMFKTPLFIVLPSYMKLIPLSSVFLGLIFGVLFSIFGKTNLGGIFTFRMFFFGSMWFIPVLRTIMFYMYFYPISRKYGKLIDMGWGEFMFSKSHVLYIYFVRKINYLAEFNNIKLFLISFIFLIFMMILYLDILNFKVQYWRYWDRIFFQIFIKNVLFFHWKWNVLI